MAENDSEIDRAARAFTEASVALADALLAKLQAEAPDIAAKACQSLQQGERMQLLLAFHPQAPSIVWQVLDDYERPKRLMTIPGQMPSRH